MSTSKKMNLSGSNSKYVAGVKMSDLSIFTSSKPLITCD